MIVIDFSHLSMRNLFTSIPKKPKFKTDDFIGIYFHQMFTSIQSIQSFQHQGYGELVLAIDSKNNWRKEAVKGYKGNRKKNRAESPVNFEEFYVEVDKLISVLRDGLGIKTIEVDNVEADDIGYVLSHITDEKTLLITEDKDWMQNLIDNPTVDLYKPIKREMLKNSQSLRKELKFYRLIHCMIGDKVDDIPNILDNLAYSDEFNKLLTEKGIEVLPPRDLEKLDIFDSLVDEFYKIYENYPKVKLYKPGRFGEKTAIKMLKDRSSFMKKHKVNHKRILENFKRNRKLIDMEKIPKIYSNQIIEYYTNYNTSKNTTMVRDFINENSLHQIKNNLNINGITCTDIEDDVMGFSGFDNMSFDFKQTKEKESKKDDLSDWGF